MTLSCLHVQTGKEERNNPMNPQVTIIYLDEYHSHPIAIAQSAFAEIERLVLAARVCRI